MLNESGLAKLKSDQLVRFFFEAYPYQRYGALSGKLNWVSPSAVAGASGQYFVGLASLDEAAHRHHLSFQPVTQHRVASPLDPVLPAQRNICVLPTLQRTSAPNRDIPTPS